VRPGPTGPDRDGAGAAGLDAEQEWLDRAYRHLEAMQTRAQAVLQVGDRAVRDENTVDARIARFHLSRREAALRSGGGPLCFGRIDTDDRERWYVGRRHVEDGDAQPVVVDWRAPVSAAFYRATALDPCGLAHRRRFVLEDRRIVALLDEDLTDPDSGSHGGLPDPLLAELDRSRSGQMRDIVATIAAEQDLIIRAPLAELLVVQGGPGTGKTAVGLHRAAFLLFEHRYTLTDRRVLVVGPNPMFLRYISEVLPSLGETTVTQTTLAGLVAARYRRRADDPEEVARLKGSLQLAAVVQVAVRARIKPLAGGLELRAGLAVVRLSGGDLEQLQKVALARRLPVNQARDVFRHLVVREGWRRYRARPGVDEATEPQFSAELRSDARVKAAIDKMWPRLSPVTIIRDLYASPRRMAAAATGVLSPSERELLGRPRAKRPNDEPWTLGDLPILDEAQFLCDGVPATYGHVVVDEAQDLSPMALRMLARRAEGGSMTILGDLAQATTPEASRSWDEALDALTAHLAELSISGEAAAVRRAELTVGYRVPAAILDVANRLLAEAAPGVTPARSVRQGGDPPLVLAVADSEVIATVVAEVSALRERVASVAVVGLGEHLDLIESALLAAGVPADRVGGAGLPGDQAVALITPQTVKGLEFDAVVVVEPADIATLDSGLRHLYVSMTRAVQHLGIVHAKPLPGALAMGAGR
jgi:DNA helicase IV